MTTNDETNPACDAVRKSGHELGRSEFHDLTLPPNKTGIESGPNNEKGMGRAKLIWKNPNAPREITAAIDAHKSRDSSDAPRRSAHAASSRTRREFISEQLMGGDASTLLDLGVVPCIDAGAARKPLPNKALRNPDSVRKGGLATGDPHSFFDCSFRHSPETSRASQGIQELGSWRDTESFNSLAAMNKKRPLTEDEKAAAELVKQTIDRGDKTQDEIAEDVGVTQGMIWQWMNGKLPVPARRAQKLATAIGLHPGQVSVAWRKVVRDSKKLAWPFSKIDPARWVDLTPGEKIRIEGMVLGAIVDIEHQKYGTKELKHQRP